MVSNSLTDRLLGFPEPLARLRFAMLIVCPSCATSYQVEPDSLGQGGRSVRCVGCRNVWFATIPVVVSTLTGSDEWNLIDTGPRVPSVESPAASAGVPQGASPDFVAIDGIDISGLSEEIDTQRAEREAESDAVLPAVDRENTATDSPSIVPAQIVASAETPLAIGGGDIESFATRRVRRDAARRGNWLRSSLSTAILVLLATNAGIVALRADIVRFLPQTAVLYAAIGLPVNLRGLGFKNIRMSQVQQKGVGVLVVEGSIINLTGRPIEVPQLRLAVRNEAKHEVYAWTALPGRSILEPGDTLPFRSRLASPPADAREVQVRFLNRRDMIAGLN